MAKRFSVNEIVEIKNVTMDITTFGMAAVICLTIILFIFIYREQVRDILAAAVVVLKAFANLLNSLADNFGRVTTIGHGDTKVELEPADPESFDPSNVLYGGKDIDVDVVFDFEDEHQTHKKNVSKDEEG